jgi:hypothetical protein
MVKSLLSHLKKEKMPAAGSFAEASWHDIFTLLAQQL